MNTLVLRWLNVGWRHFGWSLLLCAISATAAAIVVWMVAYPAWKAPTNRTYESRFGYASVQRQMDRPFEVSTAIAQEQMFQTRILGEGILARQSILVPIVPIERIVSVHVTEGDRVQAGDVLAELDTSLQDIRIRSAQLALETAEAELQRVLIGSAYVLAQERPALDELELASAEENLRILREQEELFETLVGQGALPLVNLLDLRRVITETEQQVQAGEIYLEMSTEGQTHSRQIAQNAIAEARNALDVRLAELENYRIVAPADGIVESVLVQPGEYNQDTGRPAFVLASGLWFEAQVDQSALDLVSVGQVASVFLEARRGHPLNGVVERVVPVVTFNLGGPETNRPIRPKGTGAPEWPATFAVRVALPLEELPRLVPGLTGFARIESTSRGIGIPQAAVLSLSAGTGFVHVRDGDRFHTVGVRCGITSGRMTQVFGLDEGTEVLASGHTSLQADDQIKVVGNYVDPTWHAQP